MTTFFSKIKFLKNAFVLSIITILLLTTMITNVSAQEIVLKYHKGYYIPLGFVGGAMTWQGAVRFTEQEYSDYIGWNIIALNWYHYESDTPKTGNVYVYNDSGNPSIPGEQIGIGTYTDAGPGWIRVDLNTPYPKIPESGSIWISVEIVQNESGYPFGIDAGPAVDLKGDFIYQSGTWFELQNIGFDNNWCLEAVLEEDNPPCCFEVDATYILNTVQQGVHITVKNICDEMQYEVPWNLTITGGLVLNVNGRFKDGLIQNLKPGDTVKLKHKVIGLGNIHIIVNVDDCPPFEFDAFLIGPFTIRQETENKYHSCGC
jgi:hypothetical protein